MNSMLGFGGTQFVPGVGWVQDNGGGVQGLGGEADVMMISGVGQDTGTSYSGSATQPLPGFADLKATLSNKYRFFGVELPLWMWLLVAVGAVGAGYVLFQKYTK